MQLHPEPAPVPLEFAVCGCCSKSERGPPGESTFCSKLSNDIEVSILEGANGLRIAEVSGRVKTEKGAFSRQHLHVYGMLSYVLHKLWLSGSGSVIEWGVHKLTILVVISIIQNVVGLVQHRS